MYNPTTNVQNKTYKRVVQMPVKDKLLTDRQIRNAKPGTLNDGNGLNLRIGNGGKSSWVLRYTRNGKAANVGLGSFPSVRLKEARALAAERRAEIAEGVKPAGARETKPNNPAAPTFREIAQQVIEFRRPTWRSERHATQWTESLSLYAYPAIGNKPVREITSRDVLAILQPIWNEKAETATRVMQRISVVLDYSVAVGLRLDNPIPTVKRALPRRPRRKAHHPALDPGDVPAAMRKVRDSSTQELTKLAFELMVLTATRQGELRGMTWDEINWECATWTIPADRMKAAVEHKIPLSDRAIEILRRARGLTRGRGPLVFPSKRSANGQLSDMAFTNLLRREKIAAVPHGFRASFRTWAQSQPGVSWATCERALAHKLGGSEVEAYARGDMLAERRELMAAWADYIT